MTRKQTALYVARLGVTLFLITALVAAALAEKTRQGQYPSPLWK